MKVIKQTILYCVCENFQSFNFISVPDPQHCFSRLYSQKYKYFTINPKMGRIYDTICVTYVRFIQSLTFQLNSAQIQLFILSRFDTAKFDRADCRRPLPFRIKLFTRRYRTVPYPTTDQCCELMFIESESGSGCRLFLANLDADTNPDFK